jgi:hypothetical protein
MAVSYTNDFTREDHGNLFVCVLYFFASIKNIPFDSDKVYSKLPIGGFNNKEQARAELVQFLEDERPFQFLSTNHRV